MAPKILITGGAGYIGGSIIAELLSPEIKHIQDAKLSTTVRSADQIEVLSKLGIDVFQLDLNDQGALIDTISQNEIDIVVHTASSAVPSHVHNLIKALGHRHKQSGSPVYLIHSGITALFTEEGGWPFGEIRDSDNVFDKEEQLGATNPAREVDILVVKESKAQGVTAFNVVVPSVYGKGNGEFRKISTAIPSFVRTSMKHKTVFKFEHDANATFTHISDLSKLYALLISKILKNEKLPSGEQGYYFAFSHQTSWWSFMQRLASSLHDRGLISSPELQTYPSYDEAAGYLGWPRQFVRAMGTNSGQLVAVNAYRHLGWQPEWNEQRFLESADEEVENVLKFDDYAPSLFKPLMAKGE